MRYIAVILNFVALLFVAPIVGAQEATPSGIPAAAEMSIHVIIDELAPDNVATIGVTSTTYDAAGGLHLVAGSGPVVIVLAAGALIVNPAVSTSQSSIVRSGTVDPDNGEVVEQESDLNVGDALVIPAGAEVKIRNDGDEPAISLDLVAAPDTRTENESGIAHAVMVSQEVTLPSPPLNLTLSRTTLEPGEQYAALAAPVVTLLATVARYQTFMLTGQGINRGATPMEVYVLTMEPVTA